MTFSWEYKISLQILTEAEISLEIPIETQVSLETLRETQISLQTLNFWESQISWQGIKVFFRVPRSRRHLIYCLRQVLWELRGVT